MAHKKPKERPQERRDREVKEDSVPEPAESPSPPAEPEEPAPTTERTGPRIRNGHTP